MIRVRTVLTGVTGSPYYSNLYFGGDTSGEAQAAVTAVDNFLTNTANLLCTPMVWTVEGEVPQIDPATGDILQVFSVGDETGAATASEEAAPLASQLLCRFRTGVYIGGRELRGRMFLPYIGISAISDGVVFPTTATALNADLLTLLTDASAAGNLHVWSRTHGQSAEVSSAACWGQLAVLRSRRD